MVHTLPGRSNMLLGLPHRLQSGLELFPRQLPHGRYHTQPLRKLQLIELQHGSPPRSDSARCSACRKEAARVGNLSAHGGNERWNADSTGRGRQPFRAAGPLKGRRIE
jgi:hypothetical protein